MSVVVTEVAHVWPETEVVQSVVVDQMEKALKDKVESLYAENAIYQLRKRFYDVDKDRDNKLTKTEFVQFVTEKLNFGGYDKQLAALFARFDLDKSGTLSIDEFTNFLFDSSASKATSAIGKVREILTRRAGGVHSLKAMGIQFQIADRDKSGHVDKEEFEIALSKFLGGFGVRFSHREISDLFDLFDKDKSASISYDEFVRALRGEMNDFRRKFVKMAFEVLDKDKDATITLAEMQAAYDVSKHPLVVSGKINPADALRSMMSLWGNKKQQDTVKFEEFVEYYQWISSSIDNDEYFELMIRNCWHISGGEGAAQNTTCLRVLVIHTDGKQTIQEVKNDFGLDRTNNQEIRRRLEAQGVKDIAKISLDGTE